MSYNNKLLESKTNSLTIAFLKIERLEINLTKEVKGLYAENYRILMKKKKIEEDRNKWKDISS